MTPEEQKAVQDALLAKYSAATSGNDVQQAQDTNSQNQLVNNLASALSTAVSAKSVSRGGQGADKSFFTGLNNQSQQQVQNAIAARQQKITDAMGQIGINKTFADTNLKQAEADRDQQRAGIEQDKLSETVRHNQSEEDLTKSQNDVSNKATAAKLQELRDNKDRAADDKAAQRHQQALTSTTQLLEGARGQPAAQQAEKDIYAASKVNSLANMYGDPNKLSQSQVKLLAQEVGKIAAGGSSTQSELEGITPNTLTGRMSQFVTNLTNDPTPANAAAFVKQYKQYSDALVGDARKVIKDRYGRILESRKSTLDPDDADVLQKQYIDRFTNEDEQAKADKDGPKPSWAQ